MVKKILYYAQVGIYVALAGLVLGCMLTNGVWYGRVRRINRDN